MNCRGWKQDPPITETDYSETGTCTGFWAWILDIATYYCYGGELVYISIDLKFFSGDYVAEFIS